MRRLWHVVRAALARSAKAARDRHGAPDEMAPSEKSQPTFAAVFPPPLSSPKEEPSSSSEWFRAWEKWIFPVVRHKMLLIMIGGALGTAARYLLSKWFNEQPWAQGFPYGTFVVNVSGSFLLGAVAVVILERLPPAHEDWYLLIGTGFCGGYTTFSTFEWETYKLIRDGSWWHALANAFGSVLAGFVGILLAVILVNGIFPRR